MSTAANKALVRRFYQTVLSEGQLDALDDIFAADYVGHDPNLPLLPPGPEGMALFTFVSRLAFPDQQVTVEDLFASGNRVAVRFTLRGTHLGNLLDVPPTGKRIQVQGLAIYRIANGKIAEGWINLDLAGLLAQLGLLEHLDVTSDRSGWPPAPPGASAGATETTAPAE